MSILRFVGTNQEFGEWLKMWRMGFTNEYVSCLAYAISSQEGPEKTTTSSIPKLLIKVTA